MQEVNSCCNENTSGRSLDVVRIYFLCIICHISMESLIWTTLSDVLSKFFSVLDSNLNRCSSQHKIQQHCTNHSDDLQRKKKEGKNRILLLLWRHSMAAMSALVAKQKLNMLFKNNFKMLRKILMECTLFLFFL